MLLNFFSYLRKMDGIEIHPFIFPALGCFFLWFITKYFSKNQNYQKQPPSPWKLPVIGNLHQLGALPHRKLRSLSLKHGPLMLLHFGSVPVLIVSSAEAVREIVKTHDVVFSDRPVYRVFKSCFYDGKDIAFAQYGEYWRRARSIFVLKLMSNRRVRSFQSIRDEETELFLKRAGTGRAVNLSEMFPAFMNDVICRSAFGRTYSEWESGRKFLSLVDELSHVLGSPRVGDFIPWLSFFDRVSGLDGRIDKVAKAFDDFLENVIQERLETLKVQDLGEDGGENFVDILLNIYNGNVAEFSIDDRDVIKAILLDVFTGGTGTPSVFLEWVMTELLANPAVMEKLQREVRQIVQHKPDHRITDEDLEKMHYLKAVIKETFRLHVPIPVLPPKVARSDVIINGYNIPAGTVLMINAWAIGRDPASYPDEPEKYKPERFLNSSIDFKGQDFELLPFGAGRRGCPAVTFSAAMIEFLIANLVLKYNWNLPDGDNGEKGFNLSEKFGITVNKSTPLLAVAVKPNLQ